MIRFGQDVCRDLNQALSLEWLETNGLGGFASSSILGANTRRYHGLLVAALNPPVERNVLLSKIDETVLTGDADVELGCNLFPGAVHPQGFQTLEEFRLDPWPVWRWNTGGARIEKAVCLLAGEDTVVVEYQLLGKAPSAVGLALRPFVAFRDYHSMAHANESLDGTVTERDGAASIRPYSGLPELFFSYGDAALSRTGDWYYKFQYPRERERGLDDEEDLFQPFVLEFSLTPERPVQMIISTRDPIGRDPVALLNHERARRQPSSTELSPALRTAATQFFVARAKESTVIAGYHWFTDWGRDTMIALPGLALKTGRADIARSVLLAFLPWLHEGLLPNRFPDAGEQPEYNASDATLWFVEALRALAQEKSDYDFVRERFYEACKEIVDWRKRGTQFGIKLDPDGLLSGGAPGVQLTWMDAKVGERVITQRSGKPVEIQALWYNALRIVADFAGRFSDPAFAAECNAIAERARGSFAAQFWNESLGCLFDVVDGDDRDASIRPNQVLALSLPYAIFDDPHKSRSILAVVQRELLTPFGLRTLSPGDSRYRGRYEGNQDSRDSAYHQGTVWPWLLGPYVRALLAVNGKSKATVAEARRLLEPFRSHLLQAGIGQISEIFDGDAPHAPRGCIAQAWSVAELLSVAIDLES